MPIDIRARLVSVSRVAGYSSSLLATQASYYGILGTTDADQQRDGDFVGKSARYRRAAEYFQVMRLWLESESPFDFSGEFYRVNDALAGHRPPGGVVLSYGGSSDESLELAGQYADVYAVTAEPLYRLRLACVRRFP